MANQTAKEIIQDSATRKLIAILVFVVLAVIFGGPARAVAGEFNSPKSYLAMSTVDLRAQFKKAVLKNISKKNVRKMVNRGSAEKLAAAMSGFTFEHSQSSVLPARN